MGVWRRPFLAEEVFFFFTKNSIGAVISGCGKHLKVYQPGGNQLPYFPSHIGGTHSGVVVEFLKTERLC